MDLQFAPKLKHDLLNPDHFNKMKVSNSFNVIHHNVSSALKFVASEENDNDCIATAWFLDTVFKWFKLLTSRSTVLALSLFNIEIYNDTIDFLKMVIDLFTNIKIGPQKNGQSVWKPIQTGVILTTTSILDLQHAFLHVKKHKFLLTSRFTQDCLENSFSQLRYRQPIPTAIQFKNNLKNLCVSQYLTNPRIKTSYEEDEAEHLPGFLDAITQVKVHTNVEEDITLHEGWNNDKKELNNREQNILYNCAGYIFRSVRKHQRVCHNCISSVGSKNTLNTNFTYFTRLKEYKRNCLHYVNEKTFQLFLHMEQTFCNLKNACDMSSNVKNLTKFLRTTIKNEADIMKIKYPNCHNIKEKLIHRFIAYRLKIYSLRIKHNIKRQLKYRSYGSKSITMRKLAEGLKKL